MTDLALTDDAVLRPHRHGPASGSSALVAEALAGMDDGELFLEYSQSESLALDDGRIKSAALRHDARASACARSPARRPATPMPPSFRRTAIRRAGDDGARGAPAAMAAAWRRRRPAPTAASTPTTIRSALVDFAAKTQAAGRDRRLCPRPGPARRARSWPRSAASGRRCRSCAPTAAASPTSARWCGSTSRSSSARATAWRPAPPAPAAASPMTAISIPAHWKAPGRRGAAPGAGQSRLGAGAGRRDDGGARAGLAGRHAARGGRPRARGRFQPQEDLGLRRPDRASASPRTGVTVVDDGTIARPARLAHHRRRGHADRTHRADRGRHPQRLHAGPPERPPDGHRADRQRPAPELCPCADAAHDQHLHAGRRQRPAGDHRAR